jgi:hypothetical protein
MSSSWRGDVRGDEKKASEQKLMCSLHAVLDTDDLVPKLIQVDYLR